MIAIVELNEPALSVATGGRGSETAETVEVVEGVDTVETEVLALPRVSAVNSTVEDESREVPVESTLVASLLALAEVSGVALLVLVMESPAFSEPAVVVGIEDEISPPVVVALSSLELFILRTVKYSHRGKRCGEALEGRWRRGA